MALNSINTNVAAYAAQSNISKASNMAGSSIARLSSGDRIARAADDVSALSVGTALRTQVTTLRQALVNTNQGSSLLQVADGALAQVTDILQRQKSIAVQAGSGSLTDTERGYLNQEFQSLSSEIDRLVDSTNFNGVQLLAGGLNTQTSLVSTDALAAIFDPTGADGNAAGFAEASTTAIEGFDVTDGTTLNGAGGAGEFDIVSTGTTTVLADQAYLGVNSSLYGGFDDFSISDVSFGIAATLNVTINGVVYSGAAADAATTITVSNGNTSLNLGISAFEVGDSGEVANTEAQLTIDYQDASIMRTMTVDGVNFDGTRLEGAEGLATMGNAMIRVAANSADISNFRYTGNAGAADTSSLAVDINGTTFTATGVLDAITDGNILVFQDSTGQALQIDLTGLDEDFTTTQNIRVDETARKQFIDALNIGFANAGGGLDFAVGGSADDNIRIQLDSVGTASIFRGETLSVATAQDAQSASVAIDAALNIVTAARATVGSLQSRFDFAAANVESSIQNQDAARGTLLDTDIAAESTSFATSQVQLQAGISVLAQANLLPQNLLKLIG